MPDPSYLLIARVHGVAARSAELSELTARRRSGLTAARRERRRAIR
jgi:hypothetical protein